MAFYPLVYPIHMGGGDDVSLFGELTDGFQDIAYDTCYNTNQTLLDSIANTFSNTSEISSSYPASPLVESPLEKEPQTFDTQSSANSLGSFHNSPHGSIEEHETRRVDVVGASERFLTSAVFEISTIQQVDRRASPPSATRHQETHNHLMTCAPFNFVPQAHMIYTQSMHDITILEDTTGFWAPQYVVQDPPLDCSEQGLGATYCLNLSTSSDRSTASTATQTSDDLLVDSIALREHSPAARMPPTITKTNINRPSSRNFPCNINGCTRSYTRKFELARHLKRHSGSKEHHCRFSTCAWAAPNGFTRKDHLKQHLRQVHKTST